MWHHGALKDGSGRENYQTMGLAKGHHFALLGCAICQVTKWWRPQIINIDCHATF